VRLYFYPGACSLAPHIIMREASVSFELERVELIGPKSVNGTAFNAISSKEMVPVLELDDGNRLTEGAIITQYICDQVERRDLMPEPGSMARYRVMEWQNYIGTELHKSFSPLINPQLSADAKSVLVQGLRQKLQWVASVLKPGGFLVGERFTAADSYLFTVLRWPAAFAVPVDDLPGLATYVTSIAARPAVRAALAAEGLT
jgi:glutathione S-transferase